MILLQNFTKNKKTCITRKKILKNFIYMQYMELKEKYKKTIIKLKKTI